jgi:hypothetical protein
VLQAQRFSRAPASSLVHAGANWGRPPRPRSMSVPLQRTHETQARKEAVGGANWGRPPRPRSMSVCLFQRAGNTCELQEAVGDLLHRLPLRFDGPSVLRLVYHLHTSAYVSIRQHTSAYVSIRQHTSASMALRSWASSTTCTHAIALLYVCSSLAQ